MSLKLYDEFNQEIAVSLSTFPGGEPHVNSVNGGISLRRQPMLIDARVRSFNDLGEVLVLAEFLHEEGCDVHLNLPYVPGARQDRGNPLTAKLYANLLNARDFKTITIVDPHSDVTPALLNRPYILSIINAGVREFLGEANYRGLICPDAGAEKRVNKVAKATGLEVFHATKQRDSSGKIVRVSCEPLPYGRFCVVDDILDGGSTFVQLKQAIDKEYLNVELDLWATHTIQDRGRFAIQHAGYKRLGTTDSFYNLYGDATPDGVAIYPLFERMMNHAK